MIRKKVTSALILCALLSGCGQNGLTNANNAGAAAYNAGLTGNGVNATDTLPPKSAADAIGALPPGIASGPETINIPRRFQPLSVKALASGGDVHIYTGKRWHGREVTIYYIPSQNVVYDGTHYYLRSAANLQRIGSTSIRADGLWTYVWHIGHEYLVPYREMFFLVRSDTGEIGLTQVQHFRNHKY